ncbi:YdcF family protein [Phreatobacter stygius]|uniref:YdcF family protein n=1 Tax=Phreatobacter stygius TaxID=1940610 RepID=UPI001476FAF6|nr:YdcF family protein [Phreatobacter stygius]
MTPVTEQRRRGRWLFRPAPVVLGLCLVGLTGLAIGFIPFARSATRVAETDGPRAEAIVAMTGGSSRLTDAIALLGTGQGRRLLISGVNPMVGERELARLIPGSAALMQCCIDLDHRALNTLGNAMETGKWVRSNGFRSVLVVTSSYHMPRTMLELQRVLPDVKLIAYPVSTEAMKRNVWWKDPPSLKILSFEYAKYLMAAVRLRLDIPTAEPRTARAATY